MIIACPACATRYVVPDSAIGVDGRTVRCAKCRHSWFQDGPELSPAPPPASPPAPTPPRPPAAPPEVAAAAAENTSLPEHSTGFAPRGWGGAEAEPAAPPTYAEPPQEPATTPAFASEPAYADPEPPAFAPEPPPPYADPVPERFEQPFEETPSSFAHEPPFRPRRNPARLWTGAAVAFALVVAALIGAVSYWGVPDWVPLSRPTFGAAEPDLVLEFPPDRQDRRTLPNGAEFFGASGTVTNVGETTRQVPPILIVLRDGRDRKVYEWEIRAPKGELAPGESVTINEAVTDVPRSAKFAEIGWKPG